MESQARNGNQGKHSDKMALPANAVPKVVSVGNYRLTGRTLGKGNFARVEEAYHKILKSKVAIKIMDLKQIKEDYVVRNLLREARLMSVVSHPCIAALYETMHSGDVYYLVTEIVTGGDLCTFIKNQRDGCLDENLTRLFGRQLVSALAHMHSLGVVHRDLKMENIILNCSCTVVKVVDFGLSNTWTPESPLKTHCGSPEYAAPELFLPGRSYGPEVDLWSLGVIFYGMAIGQLPFQCSRSSLVNSRDKRRNLLLHINKGLSITHRKALSHLSFEFRVMLSRLLVPDPSLRISVRALLVHPYLTEHGSHVVRPDPLKPLKSQWSRIIVQEVARLNNVHLSEADQSIYEDAFGPIGGLYNILARKMMLKQVYGDPVCRKLSKEAKKALEGPRSTAKKPSCTGRRPSTVPAERIISKAENSAYVVGSVRMYNQHQPPAKVPMTAPVPRRTVENAVQAPDKTPKRKTKATRAAPHPISAQHRPNRGIATPSATSSSTRPSQGGCSAGKAAQTPARKTSNGTELQKKFVNEPIARSIAGYVANNLSNRLSRVSCIAYRLRSERV